MRVALAFVNRASLPHDHLPGLTVGAAVEFATAGVDVHLGLAEAVEVFFRTCTK